LFSLWCEDVACCQEPFRMCSYEVIPPGIVWPQSQYLLLESQVWHPVLNDL
jgi:hypothetical protein